MSYSGPCRACAGDGGIGLTRQEKAEAWQRLIYTARLVMCRVPKYCMDLFDYVSRRCNVREKNGHPVWDCRNNPIFMWAHCSRHGPGFEEIRKGLNETSAYCDWGNLMNSSASIPDREPLRKSGSSTTETPALPSIATTHRFIA